MKLRVLLAVGVCALVGQRYSFAQSTPVVNPKFSVTSYWKEPANPPQEQVPELPETVVEAERANAPTAPQPQGNDANQSQASALQNQRNANSPTGQVPFGQGAPPSRLQNLIGQAPAASAGSFGHVDIEDRARSRNTEVLELVPGLIATQHSGSGKANQYFVRGFNLDHGTDFAVSLGNVPLNLPSHGHGQGYLDVNWLIPELIESGEYKLGTYYADVGDFSSAGALNLSYRASMPYGISSLTVGSFDYYRYLLANSERLSNGAEFLYALETVFYNGPWDVPEDAAKYNGVLCWTLGNECAGLSLTAFAYSSYWNATNQIPQRAIDNGLTGRFGSLDPTDGGDTARAGLNLEYWDMNYATTTRANAYLQYYDLDLFSNFTFFLDDPINGDQIEQLDQRVYHGANISRTYHQGFVDHTFGFQYRNDHIYRLGLNRTNQRQWVSTVRSDDVDQHNFGVFYVHEAQLYSWLRSMAGIRANFYHFENVAGVNPVDSGEVDDELVSPKLGLVFGPWSDSELYLNWGQSFHSNDARGITAAVDPAVPLVRSDGSELGLRSWLTPNWNTSLAAWYLTLDSELVFVGDAGTTEPGPASHRFGLTWTNNWRINNWLTLDGDYAFVRPRFAGGDRIPNAVENVFGGGFIIREEGHPWYVSLRVRHYGPAALIEDNSVRTATTTLANMQIGYETQRMIVAVDLLNLFDREDNDITYFYESQPAGLPAADDILFHPVEPLMVRGTVTWKY